MHRRQPPEGFEPFEEQGPFLAHIGPVYVRREDGSPVRPARRGAPQQPPRDDPGRLLSTFADFALGRAIEADAGDGKDRATVSLTVDFLKPAEAGDWIESRSRVERVGGTMAFADCSLTIEEREIVRAQAVFVVVG